MTYLPRNRPFKRHCKNEYSTERCSLPSSFSPERPVSGRSHPRGGNHPGHLTSPFFGPNLNNRRPIRRAAADSGGQQTIPVSYVVELRRRDLPDEFDRYKGRPQFVLQTFKYMGFGYGFTVPLKIFKGRTFYDFCSAHFFRQNP